MLIRPSGFIKNEGLQGEQYRAVLKLLNIKEENPQKHLCKISYQLALTHTLFSQTQNAEEHNLWKKITLFFNKMLNPSTSNSTIKKVETSIDKCAYKALHINKSGFFSPSKKTNTEPHPSRSPECKR